MAAAAAAAQKDKASAAKKPKLAKKAVVDRVTELEWEAGGKAALESKKQLLFQDVSLSPFLTHD